MTPIGLKRIDLEQAVSSLSDSHAALSSLRLAMLMEYTERGQLPPFAEQHFLMALSQMEVAMTSLKMADFSKMQGL